MITLIHIDDHWINPAHVVEVTEHSVGGFVQKTMAGATLFEEPGNRKVVHIRMTETTVVVDWSLMTVIDALTQEPA